MGCVLPRRGQLSAVTEETGPALGDSRSKERRWHPNGITKGVWNQEGRARA